MRLGVIPACLALLVFTAGCAGTDAVATGGTFQFVSPGGKLQIEYPAADRKPIGALRGPDLMKPDQTISLADFSDKVIVINIWGEWCPPCREETPLLVDAQKQTTSLGVTFLGVDVRDTERQKAQDFYVNQGVTYPSIYDPEMRTLLTLGGVPSSAIPTTLILDRTHRVAAVFLGKVKPDTFLPTLNRIAQESVQ